MFSERLWRPWLEVSEGRDFGVIEWSTIQIPILSFDNLINLTLNSCFFLKNSVMKFECLNFHQCLFYSSIRPIVSRVNASIHLQVISKIRSNRDAWMTWNRTENSRSDIEQRMALMPWLEHSRPFSSQGQWQRSLNHWSWRLEVRRSWSWLNLSMLNYQQARCQKLAK